MGKLENVWQETNVKNFWTWKSFNVLLCSERNKHWESIYNGTQGSIDLFRLYICCRSCDYTGKNCVFQNSSHSRAYVRIIHKKTKGKFSWPLHSDWVNKTNKLKRSISTERFHSYFQHLCKGVGTKERVYIRKGFNSQDRQFPSSPQASVSKRGWVRRHWDENDFSFSCK